MSIRPETLDWWFKTNKNVMLIGRHGVGKTAMIKACFERHGLKHNETYLYFSASTLDPWVDLIGCPKEVKDEEGKIYLDIVRPKNLYQGKIVAIFFDEFNRSPKKVRNAVMELLQFKSINGFKFPDLKCVWTAVNPEKDELYDVEKIDPAQQDRFQIIKEIPYACDRDFFLSKFGEDITSASIEWWDDLPDAEKNLVSPRRLEYALDEFVLGGNLRDILPVSCNVTKLLQSLKTGSVQKKLENLFNDKNISESKLFLSNENNTNVAFPHIMVDEKYMSFFLPLFHKEKLVSYMTMYDKVFDHIAKEFETNVLYENILRESLIGQNNILRAKIQKVFAKKHKEKIGMTEKKELVASPSVQTMFSPTAVRSKDGVFDLLTKLHLTDFRVIEKKIESITILQTELPNDLSKEEAESALVFCGKIVESSSKNTLSSTSLSSVFNIINFLIDKLVPSYYSDLNEFWLHPKRKILAKRLTELALLDKISFYKEKEAI